jgi:FixJ family two-component response regulator
MSRPLEMLIIDDDKKFAESLHAIAQMQQILLTHKETLEDAQLFLKSDKAKRISGIILDVVCLKSKDQEVAKSNFLPAALDLLKEEAPHLPIAILTGEPDQYKGLKEFYEGNKNVYSKSMDEEKMLSFLRGEASKLDRVKTIYKYNDIIEITEEFFDAETVEDLISCLSKLNSSDNTQVKNNLACIRRLQENIYIELNKRKPDLVPTEYIDGEVKVRDILKHLREGDYVDKKTNDFGYAVYTVCSDFGSHTQNRTRDSSVSKYTVHTIAYALLDLLLWFNKVVNEN